MSDLREMSELRYELDDGVDGGEQLQVIVPRLGAVVAQVEPADLRASTPCEGWTTHDLLNHVVGGALMFADAFAGEPLRDISGRLPDAIGDDPLAAFTAAATRFGESTQLPGAMDRVLPVAFGAMTARTYLRFAAFDLMVHTWDLAMALETDPDIPVDFVDDVADFARRVLDGAPRDGVNFGRPAPVPVAASLLDQLIAYTGRDPGWRPPEGER